MTTTKKARKPSIHQLRKELAMQMVTNMDGPALQAVVANELEHELQEVLESVSRDVRYEMRGALQKHVKKMLASGAFDSQLQAAAKKVVEMGLAKIMADKG